MTTKTQLINAVRRSLDALPAEIAQQTTTPPPVSGIYIVPGHEKALNPETPIVIGDRGSGKSFWCAALNGEHSRRLISRQFQRLRLAETSVSWGFSAQRGHPDHPSRQTLDRLEAKGLDSEALWRALVLHQILRSLKMQVPGDDWEARTAFVADNPEQEERWLVEADDLLRGQGQRHLIVFDALDRLGNNWASIRRRVRGLMRVCLDLRSFTAIRTKVFFRPDMWEDRALWSFPDASKIHHGAVPLTWRRIDLYGLLWHWLANQPSEQGQDFRDWCRTQHRQAFEQIAIAEGQSAFVVPTALRSDETQQKDLLKDLASPYMGTNPRRGRTYTWLPTHLADAKGSVSPRSFMLALKQAHAVSPEKGSGEALHYEGIKRGVADASRVRLVELCEDYPWIDQVLMPLKGLTVPITREDLFRRWREHDVLTRVIAPTPEDTANRENAAHTEDERQYLPPHAVEASQDFADRQEAMVRTMIEIGIMTPMPDGRLNIPDLFRVAAGIGRRGGVRAIR